MALIRRLAVASPFVPLTLAALLLVAARVQAASTCLTNPFTLEDQRDLASLRTATDTACPCSGFAKRSDYQRCARGVLDAAVQNGSLREACKRNARRILKGSSCSSEKVACGRVRVADLEAGCQLRPANRCTDTSNLMRSPCTLETHCADVVDWSAGTCFDVRDLGPFAPGYRVIQYTKDSVANPGTPRVLDTSIWYPAPPGSSPITPMTGGVENAPVDPSGGPYPVVLFSHGSCGYPLQSVFLTPLLASHGFIVVAPPHPGNTLFEFPNCGTPAALAAAINERPQDMIFVLDQILAADQDSGSPFFGAVDEDLIAMTGHSFGGLTTYLVTANEPRIDVAIPMAPATLANSELAVPSLTMLGNIDSVVNNPNALAAFDRSASPKLLVEIEHAGHYAFSNLCFPSADCNPPVTLTQEEAHDAVLRYVLPFLKVRLEGNLAWAPLLEPPTRPGLLYTAE